MTRQRGLLLALVLALVAGAYASALAVGFVWDDRALVATGADGAASGHGSDVLSAVSKPFWGDAAGGGDEVAPYFRPVSSASFALDEALYRDNPAGYHLTNVALHLLACALLFALCLRFGAPGMAALLAALVLGSDARLTECVTWISGRTDVLAAAIAFAGALVWPRGASRGRTIGAALLFAAAFLAKETALAVPLALALAERSEWREWRRWSAVAGALALAVLARVFVLRDIASSANELPLADRAVASLEALGRYAWMLVDPWQPRLQIGLVSAHAVGFVLAGALLVALVVTLAVVARRRGVSLAPGEVFGLSFAALALLFVVPLGPARISVVAADRFLYLPVAGLALAAAVAARRWFPLASEPGSAERQNARVAVTLVTLFALTSLAVVPRRNAVWADEIVLWLETSETAAKGDTIPITALGAALLRADAFEQALQTHLLAASRAGLGSPEQGRSYLRAAVAASRLGDLQRWPALLLSASASLGDTPRLLARRARADLARGGFIAARQEAEASAAGGFVDASGGESLVALISRTEAESHALESEPPSSGASALNVRRARLATAMGRRAGSLPRWRDVASDPAVDPATLHDAVLALVQEGDITTIPEGEQALLLLSRRAPNDPLLEPLAETLAARHAIADELDTLAPRLAALRN